MIVATPTRGHPVVEEGCFAPHEGDGQLLEEAIDLQRLFFPSVSCLGAAQLFHLHYGRLVPSSQRLGGERDVIDLETIKFLVAVI